MRNTDGHLVSTCVAGLVSGGVAFVVSLLFVTGAAQDWQAMPFAAALGAALTGSLFWRLLVIAKTRRVLLRGVAAGALTGLLSHPVAWYMLTLFLYVTGARSSLGELTLNPLDGLLGSIVLSLWSWILVGWITILVGALCGGVLAYVWSRPRKPRAIL